MEKITEYKSVMGVTNFSLITAVNKAIAEGWQPFGSICITTKTQIGEVGSSLVYSQAMVKYEEPRGRVRS